MKSILQKNQSQASLIDLDGHLSSQGESTKVLDVPSTKTGSLFESQTDSAIPTARFSTGSLPHLRSDVLSPKEGSNSRNMKIRSVFFQSEKGSSNFIHPQKASLASIPASVSSMKNLSDIPENITTKKRPIIVAKKSLRLDNQENYTGKEFKQQEYQEMPLPYSQQQQQFYSKNRKLTNFQTNKTADLAEQAAFSANIFEEKYPIQHQRARMLTSHPSSTKSKALSPQQRLMQFLYSSQPVPKSQVPSQKSIPSTNPKITAQEQKKAQFDAEVQYLEKMIDEAVTNSIPKRKNPFESRGNLFKCFQSLINFNVLNDEYDKFQMYQKSSPLVLLEARNLLKSVPVFSETGSGLILIQTFAGCFIIPVVDNNLLEDRCYMHPVGLKFLVKNMKESLQYELQGLELKDAEMDAICKEIVLKHCYFAQSFSSEKLDFKQSYNNWVLFKKPLDQLKDASRNFYDYILNIHLGYNQIQTPEMLFAALGRHKYMPPITHLLKESISKCSLSDRRNILKNIVCQGCIFQFKGFKTRMQRQIESEFKELGVSPSIRILQPSQTLE